MGPRQASLTVESVFPNTSEQRAKCDAQTVGHIAFGLQGFAYRSGVFVVWLI